LPEQPQGADRVGIGGVFGGFETHLHMALGGQIVDFRRPHLLDDPDQAGAVGEVAIVELEADIGLVQVAVEVVDPSGVEGRGAPLGAMDFIALAQQQFGEIRAVLSGHAGDQCNLVGHPLLSNQNQARHRASAAKQRFSIGPTRRAFAPRNRRAASCFDIAHENLAATPRPREPLRRRNHTPDLLASGSRTNLLAPSARK
jgi:hypothetical protein